MQHKVKEIASVLIGALVLSIFNIGLVVSPASADAPAPPLLLNFDSSATGAQPGMHFSDHGNGYFEVLADSNQPWAPANGSIGSTNLVKGVMGSGAYSGVFLALAVSTTSSLVSSATPTITMNFWSPEAGKTVKMTLESAQGVNGTSVNATSTTIVGWQTLTFNFANATPTPNYSAVLNRAFIDYDPTSTAMSQPFFFDDVSFNGATPAALTAPPLLLNFDSSATGAQPGMHFSDHGNGYFEVLADSNQPWAPANGSIGSTNLVKGVMGSGAYSGVFLALDVNTRLVSSTSTTVSMNFWSPEAGKTVKMTLESAQGVNGTSVNATSTTIVGWQTLTFNFANATPTPNYSAVLDRAFIDYDPTSTAMSQPFFFDDISFNGARAASLTVQQNQSSSSSSVSSSSSSSSSVSVVPTAPSTLFDFENETLVSAPWNNLLGYTSANDYSAWGHYVASSEQPGGSPTGLKMVKGQKGNSVSNTAIGSIATGSSLVGSSTRTVTMNFYAPTAGKEVVLGLATIDNAATITTSATALTSVGWQKLTFTFPSSVDFSVEWRRAWVAYDPARTTGGNSAENIYFFDDVSFNGAMQLGATTSPNAGFTPNNENKGKYPHIRLDKSFLDTHFDASWWDGVWQYRDADTKAYLKYLPVGGTFKLTYTVTDANNEPMAGALVTLIVNANYSCAKTYFVYENSLIGPDDCAGNGETQLPAKRTNASGQVSFVLTNTNTEGENMPNDLNGLPNGKELGTNIKPHLVGATQEGIDMLFAHFVQPKEAAKVVGPAPVTAKAGVKQVSTFQFLDEAGKPIADQYVDVFINGVGSRQTWAKTDASGRVSVVAENMLNAEGTTAVAVSINRLASLPLTATALINWVEGDVMVSMGGAMNSVAIRVSNVTNKVVKFVVDGKTYIRKHPSGSVVYKFPSAAGKKKVSVTIAGKSYVRTVTVAK